MILPTPPPLNVKFSFYHFPSSPHPDNISQGQTNFNLDILHVILTFIFYIVFLLSPFYSFFFCSNYVIFFFLIWLQFDWYWFKLYRAEDDTILVLKYILYWINKAYHQLSVSNLVRMTFSWRKYKSIFTYLLALPTCSKEIRCKLTKFCYRIWPLNT